MTPRRVEPAEIARVLTLIASRPSRRKRPRPGDAEGYDEWFDGGASRMTADGMEVRFGDGTTALVGTAGPLTVELLFPGGVRVTIRQQ